MKKGFDRDDPLMPCPDDEGPPHTLPENRQNTTRHRAIAESVACHMLSAFDHMSAAVIVVDKTGKVLLMNDHGQRLLLDGVMNLADGRIIASDLSADARLQTAIKSATLDGDRPGRSASATVFSVDQSSQGGLFVRVSPIRKNGEEPLAILVAVDPRGGMGPGSGVLQGLFDLTPAEARVAQLLATGLDVTKIAEGRGTSAGTVKHQVRSIFMKIGVSRQSEAIVILRRCMVLSSLG